MNKKNSIIVFVLATMLISCSTNMSTINNINNKQFKHLKKKHLKLITYITKNS